MTGIIRWGVLGLVALLSLWTGLVESQGDGNYSCGSSQFDLVIILDTSTSVQPVNWNKTLSATKRLVRDIDFENGNVRIGVAIFSNEAKVIFHLNAYQTKADIIDAVSRIPYEYGQTNTASALELMRTQMFSPINGDRTGVPNVAIVITDGESTIDKDKTVPEANRARQQGIQIFAIGIGLSATAELDGIAGRTENRYFIDNFDELDEKMERIYRNLCPETTTRPPTTIASTTPKGPCTETDIDLVFVLDTSTSVTQKNFQLMITAVKDFVSNADIDSGNTRIGILTYSSRVRVEFDLNTYTSKEQLLNAVNEIKYIHGDTNTADAIKLMRTRSFSALYGDREDIPNVAVVVTDGISNINHFKTIPEAELARESGIDIYAIGVGVSKKEELDAIAGKSEHRFDIEKFEELEFNLEAVYKTFCVAGKPTKAPDISPPECTLGNSDLVLVIDASTSVTQANFEKQLEFSKDLLRGADIDSGAVRVGVLIYSTEVQIEFHLNEFRSKADVFAAIDNIPYIYGSTNTADALDTMANTMFTARNGDRPDVPNTCIVITDGVSNINSRKTIPNAKNARAKGIHIYAVGIGLRDTRELDGIASEPASENSFNVQNFEELQGLDKKIFSAFCPDTPVATTPRPGPQCGLSKVDVVIILDASTSVTEGNFAKMRQFSKDIVDRANVDSGSVRIAALIYSTEVEVQFYLNQYTTNAEVKAAIDRIPYIYGSTNSADALRTMHNELFLARNGDRPDVENIAFMITDGVSNINSRRTIPEAETAMSKGIKVYAIGIGLRDTRELEGMASKPVNEHMFNVQEFDELTGLVDTIFAGGEDCGSEPPVADAGRDVTIQMPQDFVTLDGSKSRDDVEVVKYEWKQKSGPRANMLGQDSVELNLYGLQVGEYVFTLTVFDADDQSDEDDVLVRVKESKPPIADAGADVSLQLPRDSVKLDGSKSTDDVGIVTYQWEQVSGGDVKMKGRKTAVLNLNGLQTGTYNFTLTVFDADGQSDKDGVTVIVKASNPPTADAGDDISIRLPEDYVTLDGSKSSDDIEVVRYQWNQLSGGYVRMYGQNASKLSLRDLSTGEYEFQLVVYDAEGQQDADNVKVTVAAADIPPVARAGDDITIQLPVNYATLDGSGSSDDVRIARYRWRMRSGDTSGLKMEGERSPYLRLSEMKPGNYRFSLTVVDDQKLKDSDYVEVTVLQDNPPMADAGVDQTIQLPRDQTTLLGDGSSDDVRIVKYEWNQVSGDRSVFIDGNDRANPNLYNLKAGEYNFELTVTDGSGNQDSDTVRLTVLPEPTTLAPTEPPCGLDKTDVVFVVDASTSVTEPNFKKQLGFMKSIVQFADVNSGSVRFGALIYSTEVEIQFHLNQYRKKQEVLDAIDRIPYIYGSTNTADGLTTMRDQMFSFRNGDRDDAPNVAIVITDGVSNINSRRTIPDAELARDIGIHIYAVGIGLSDTRELDAIASEPASENSFNVADFDELSGLGAKIFTSTCVETTTTSTTTTTTTTTTTAPPTTSPRCGLSKTDLVFILDASTSVTETNFQKMRDFLKSFLRNADIDSGSVRVGVNIYSTDVQVVFHLNDYSTEREVMAAIQGITYIYGSTNTADALQVMRENMFIPSRGDRRDAPNICVLLTDGVSNINSRRTIPEAEATRAAGIRLYVIGIGEQVKTNSREVEGIASRPLDQNLYLIDDFDELTGLEQKMFKSVCPETPDAPPVANAGKDLTLQLPDDLAILSGSKSTDDKAIVQYNWDQLSGPRVTVSDTDDPNLELSNLKEGVYEFELTVYDERGQSDSDRVVVNVRPEIDLPPRANAGSDVTIQLPIDSVRLECNGSTDDNGIVEYRWELTSRRDSSLRYSGDDMCFFNVRNLNEGTYEFKLTVRDRKGQSDSDSVRVTVLPARDEPPVANAGRDYEIRLPTDSVTLDGSRSTDDIGITSYRWNVLSGNTRGIDVSGDDTPMLRLNNLNEGEYRVRLTVSDKMRQTDTDEARIVVKPAPERTTGYDVIFIIDSSVNPSDFRWMNEYARNVIREMSIDDGEFRVGYLIYSNNAYRQFDLKDNTKKDDVMAAVDRVNYRPGSKNTAAAFKFARYRMFTPENGDRDFAENYIIHLTGGARSNDPYSSATEACGLQNNRVGMFAVGFGEVSDTTELDASSSLPTDDYEMIIRSENEMGELPGLMIYQLKNGSPRPSRCPEEPTTRAPTGECRATGDIVFILDSSGSVGQDNFYRVLNFTYDTIDSLDIDSGRYRVGVTTFSDTSRLDFNLDEFTSKSEMENALKQRVVYMYGNTHTAHALRRARLEMFTMSAGDRPDVPNVAVIITDGQSNVNHELTLSEARALKAAGVSIITVAVGFTSETSELVGLTSPPVSENLIYVEDYKGLSKLKQKLIEPLCTDSNMCRNKPCQNGGECMDGIRSFVCICQEDFFGDTCNKRCGEPADVVIVLDSSNTVGEYNFGRLKEYAEHLVREMNKDTCDLNIGFLKYSSAAMVQVNLGTYSDTETNIRALDQISYSRGRANMAAAFRALRTEMFNGANGDRSGARNIAYFLTDGTNDVNADMAEPEAELTISSGVRIIPIGINLRERFELDNIAGNQGISVIEIGDEPALIENTETILRPLYSGNDFCGEDPCANGGACFNEPFGFRCDCPIGYTGETCQRRCTARGDVVFAVDTSRYVTRSELKKVRRFLRSVVKRMKFRNEEFSVGMVQFTDWAKVTLDFDSGKSKKAVRSSIAGLRVHGGDPEPATALAKANFRIFNGRGEDRDKPDYLILVTKSMRNELKVLEEANKLKMQGTRVLGVGIGLTNDEREVMESSVSMPYQQTAMFADDAKELIDIADRVVEYMCDDEDICAENPCRNGGVCRRLSGEIYCECGIGFAGKFCENRCQARADVVFLLDSSGSVGHADFRRVKQFVHSLVSDLQIGKDKTRIGLVTYSSNSRHGFYMSKYYNLHELQNAIAGISYEYGDTNTASGLRLVRERYFGGTNGDRADIQNFLVVVTDGVSNIDPDQTIVEANLLKEQGVHIYAVGIGNFDPYEINSIASSPSTQNAFILQDYRALSNISSSIVKKTCRDPTVCDENPCRNGGLCVPGINGPFCECRAGYRGEFCQDSCVTVKDIYFLMDSSDSVGQRNFQTALNFIASIVEEFSGEGSYNRFSLLTFSDDVQIVFSLGRYTRLPVLMNAIKFARYRPGNTNTAGAFRTVSEIAVDVLGDRYDAENIIFLIADGNGNIDESTTVSEAQSLKDKGARIIPIAVNMEDYSEIEQIASNRNDIFKVNDFSKLESILEDVILTTCKNGNEINTGK